MGKYFKQRWEKQKTIIEEYWINKKDIKILPIKNYIYE
jgi:hypothetical protein